MRFWNLKRRCADDNIHQSKRQNSQRSDIMITISAQPRWRAPLNPYKIEGSNVIVGGNSEIRKITGTYIGQMLGVSAYGTPFTASCQLLGINDRDLQGNKAVATGKALEPRILDYLSAKHQDVGTFLSAESVFQPREGNHEDWVSDWEDPDFSGHVDGIISKDGQDYILEIKTVKSVDHWQGQIPLHYMWQVYLYNHFITQKDKQYFGVGVVSDQDYQNPDHWQPNAYNCMLIEIPIDRIMVAAEIDRLREVRAMLADTRTITSYNPDNKNDVELMTHFKDFTATKDELFELSNRATQLSQSLMEKKTAFKQEEIEFETLKARLKDIMLQGNVTGIGDVYIKIQNRISYDISQAIRDGVDMEKYAITTETPSIYFKKR